MIYHLIPPADWEKVLEKGQIKYKPQSLKTEGFIHCSTEEQLFESAELHFAEHEELVVLCIVDKWIKTKLKWEEGRNQELFPHIYGYLPLHAVDTTRHIVRNADGKFEWQ